MFNRITLRTTLLVASILLGLAGYFGWQHWHTDAKVLESYRLAAVQRGDLEDLVTATGTMQPREYVDVGTQVSGQLRKIHVEIGSVVKAGDLLAEIDPTVYLANVDARRALLRNQRAMLADRKSQLTLAQSQQQRQKNLMAGDATTAEAVQAAEAAVQSAAAQMEALKAQIEQTESTLRADEANLHYAKIHAPIEGVVVSIAARQGQTLNANQQAPTVLRIADLSTMTVQAQVSEADVGQLRPEMAVYFTTLGSRNRRWNSTLRKVEPTPVVTNNVVLYNALFDVPNAQHKLLPQMTAQVFFVAAAAKNALIVPASAVQFQRHPGAKGTGAREGIVKVVNKEGKIEERKVQTGISNRVQVQILSGLNEGEQVIAGDKQPAAAPKGQGQQGQRNALQGAGTGMGGRGPR